MPEVKKEKSRVSMIIDGDIEPATKEERKYLNLRKRTPITARPPEEQKEIRRKGAEAARKIQGEKKTAKQSIEKILSLKVPEAMERKADPALIQRLKQAVPDATLYDLINTIAIERAIDGSIRAAEYVRDTAGDRPTEKIQADINNVMTEADRALLETIAARIDGGSLEVVKDITE